MQSLSSFTRAYMIEELERRRGSNAPLGFSQVNYGRLFIRDFWTLFAIAVELECSIADLLPETERQSEGDVRYADLVCASEDVMRAIRLLPTHITTVVIARLRGDSWRAINLILPGRASFSLRDDLATGLRKTSDVCESQLRMLGEADAFFIAKKNFIVADGRKSCYKPTRMREDVSASRVPQKKRPPELDARAA
jgi:hypothetical protein